MQSLDEDDILDILGEEAFRLGGGHIEDEEVTGATVSPNGRIVSGSVREGRRSFKQVINIKMSGGLRIDGQCTCPGRANCSHVAAVLLYARKQGMFPSVASGEGDLLTRAQNLEPGLSCWIEALEAAQKPQGGPTPPAGAGLPSRHIVYVIGPRGGARRQTFMEPITVELNAEGDYSAHRRPFDPGVVLNPAPPGHLKDEDYYILRELFWIVRRNLMPEPSYSIPLPPTAEGARILAAAIATGRCRAGGLEGPVVRGAPARSASPRWAMAEGGEQRLIFDFGERGADPPSILPVAPPCYLDKRTGACGPIELGLPAEAAAQLAAAPAVPNRMAAGVATILDLKFGASPFSAAIPRPKAPDAIAVRQVEPVPVLRLFARPLSFAAVAWMDEDDQPGLDLPDEEEIPLARLAFAYGAAQVTLEQRAETVESLEGGRLSLMPRRRDLERQAVRRLGEAGLERLASQSRFAAPPGCEHDFWLPPKQGDAAEIASLLGQDRHLAFAAEEAPRLEAEGWRIEFDASYPFRVVKGDMAWWAELGRSYEEEGSSEDWFSFALGVEFEGERVDLLETLLNFLDNLPPALANTRFEPGGGLVSAYIESVAVFHELADGRMLQLPVERTAPILKALFELNGNMFASTLTEGHFLPRSLAHVLSNFEALSQDAGLDWKGGEDLSKLLELGERLRHLDGLPAAPVPAAFAGSLRSYQQAGFDWFAFLGGMGLGGVLADDMGLGKTVQALCFIAAEKDAGRLDAPALIVAPTSVLPNWVSEAARFVPTLKVLSLHGPDRKERFAAIPGHDIALTTYPLLARDREALAAHRYHAAILDEAQAIKNPSSAAAEAACALKAKHRFALTGTPLENNLTDIWSLFRYINPNLLGDRTSFKAKFRDPIEKEGDPAAKAMLARRLKPFMLRRTKDTVARELPPKTEIIEYVEMEGAQRDLYETIRLSTHKAVRDAIAAKGLARCRIAILDALLKLRQACCDPQLVKLDAARDVEESAKRERLMELICELAAEGRRTLVFSQFTSMLALIEEDLKDEEIAYLKLTGDTRDRAAPVAAFQSGKAPVFLISLKAGGSGLNLTAADTVIHYDPWWNPAAEEQAADRAYRIGQDKPVFVHKLIARNTVEEGIQELKTRKAALAEALFSEADSGGGLKFTEADIDALFAIGG